MIASGDEILGDKETGNWTVATPPLYSHNSCSSYGHLWYFRDEGDSSWTNTGDTDDSYSRVMTGIDFEVKIVTTCGSHTDNDIVAVVFDGLGKKGDQRSEPTSLPVAFALNQNYPNPFNPETAITLELPEASHVRLVVVDATGREVAVLTDQVRGAGTHTFHFDAEGLPSGIYLYRVTANEYSAARQMVLLK